MTGPAGPPEPAPPPPGRLPPETVPWRSIAVPAYGPTLLVSIGQGAILPLVALSARDLGASIGVAAFLVGLIGLSQLVGDLPAVSISVIGLSNAVFSLARLAYLAEAIPIGLRARGMATLGGTFRIGFFVGPFIAAAIVSRWSISAAYAFAAGLSLAAAVLCLFLPDVTRQRRRDAADAARPHRSVLSVLAEHRRV